MEEMIRFSFKGKEYAASVLSSLEMTPHYHWVIFRQPEMRELLGEEVAFVVKNSELKPVNVFLANKNRELFNQIQSAMEKHLTAL
ncbi:MAG TPA: hypothetical protein VF145_03930 [Chitinophagaceae bacterium]